MKNHLQLFQYHGHKVRTVIKDGGDIWFVAADICRVLEISNRHDTVSRLDEDEKDDVGITDTIGRNQKTTVINESGLYSLIMSSRKPEAKRLKKWVTAEVLPTIRKTGRYEVSQQHHIPQTFGEALKLACEQQLQLEAQQQMLETQQKQIHLAQPKVQAFDDFMSSEGNQTIEMVAKALDLRVNNFFKFLRQIGLLRENRLPMQLYIERGYFTVHIFPYFSHRSQAKNRGKTLVTPKGVEYIRKKINQHRDVARSMHIFSGKEDDHTQY